MTKHASEISDNRSLNSGESKLVRWLLENGTSSESISFLHQVNDLRVVSRCSCGCVSVNFTEYSGPSMNVLSDYQWTTADGHRCGVFVFANADRIAGLEVWSIDGLSTIDYLPEIADLKPMTELQ